MADAGAGLPAKGIVECGPRSQASSTHASHAAFPHGQERSSTSEELMLGASCCQRLDRRISTADSLTALLWSSILRARTKHDSRGDTISTLMMAMDVRRHLEPPISNKYLGNCVLYSRAESTAQEISRSLSLGSIAQILRASLREVQQIPVINETLKLAASIPDVRALGLLYPTWLAHDVVVSSIYGLPFYELDFGRTFGERSLPDFFRFPDGVFDGICFVLPRLSDGTVEIQVTMDEAHMQNLVHDEEVCNYFTTIS